MRGIARQDERGMTLIELLAVIVILGIIAAIGVIAISGVIQKQKDQAFVGNALALKEGASIYIQQQLAQGDELPEIVTYENLSEERIIDRIKDPDTGHYLEPTENSYVQLTGNAPSAVCLIGDRRNLCSKDGVEGPILFSELSRELLAEN